MTCYLYAQVTLPQYVGRPANRKIRISVTKEYNENYTYYIYQLAH